MSKYKAGDEVTYEIGGKKLRLTPMKWGRLKKVMKLAAENMAVLSDPEFAKNPQKILQWVSELLQAHSDDFFPLIVDTKENPFFTNEWVDDNMDLNAIKTLVMDAIDINGVSDFFGEKGKPAPISPATDSPLENQSPKKEAVAS